MFDTTLCLPWGRGRSLLVGLLFASTAVSSAKTTVRWDSLDDIGNLGRVSSIEVSPFDSHKIIAGGDVLGVGLTNDAGATWQQTLGFINYEDNDITFHPKNPNIIWIGTLGGPYKSTDGGLTWTLKRNGMPPGGSIITAPIERVIFDPHNNNTLLAFAGNHRHMGYGKTGTTAWGGVWKSTDAGEHWTQIATIDDAAVGEPHDGTGAMINDVGFAAGSSNILFACSDEHGVYKSIDGGYHWMKINAGLPNNRAWSIALHPTNPNILWVSMGDGGGVYKSTDAGRSWQTSTKGMETTPSTVYRTLAVARSNPNYLYCCAWEGTGNTYRSTDGGNNWTCIISHGSHRTIIGGTGDSSSLVFQRINVDPNNAKHVVGACEGMVVQSWDAGDTWKDITCLPADGGWRGNGYSGMCGTRIAWDPYKPGLVFTLGDDEGKLERSPDYLWSWKLTGAYPNLIGPFNGSSDISFAADGTIYIGNGQFGNHVPPYANEPIIKSPDGGSTWVYVKRPMGAIGDNRAVYVNPANSSQVWCITGGASTGTLYKSTDGGSHWAAQNLGDSGGLWNIAVDPRNTATMYIGAQSGIFKTTDGQHFSRMSGSPTSQNYEYAYLDPIDPSLLYAVSFNSGALGGLYRYKNSNWSRLFTHPQTRTIAIDPANPQRIALETQGWASFDHTTGQGIFISEDGGATWTESNTGLRMLDGPAIAFNPNKSGQLILATNGAGFFATDLGDSTPHGGKIRSVVGTLSAGDYDDGLQGFSASSGRRATDLDQLRAGQWAKYRVHVPTSGYYDVTLEAASTTGGQFHLEFNGVNVTGPVKVQATASPTAWTEVHIPHVQLVAGDQYMEYFAESDNVNVHSFQMRNQ